MKLEYRFTEFVIFAGPGEHDWITLKTVRPIEQGGNSYYTSGEFQDWEPYKRLDKPMKLTFLGILVRHGIKYGSWKKL